MQPVTRDEILMLAKRAEANRLNRTDQVEIANTLFLLGGGLPPFSPCARRSDLLDDDIAMKRGVKLANLLLLDEETS